MSKIETVKNKRGANLAIGEVKPNSFNYYDDCTIDVQIFVYSDDFSKRCSFWLANVRTGFTGDSWMDGYYEDELESNPDFTDGMELSEIYTDEELEERAMEDTIWLLFDSYSLEDNPIFDDPILDCVNRIEDAIAKQQVYLFNENCDIEDSEIDALLLDSPEKAWSDLIEEDILDYEAIDEDDHERVDYFKKETLKVEVPKDDAVTVPEEVPASALDYCRDHPAHCLLLPLAICKGMLRTSFVQPAGLPAKMLKKFGECDWTKSDEAETTLVSIRNLVLSELKKSRWVDIKDEYFYRYEYCGDAVEKSAAELRDLCRLLETLCPKECYDLSLGQPFEFNTDRSRDFLRLREEHNLVIPEKLAYDFLVGNDLRQRYSKVILDKDEQTTRLSLIQSEVFSEIEEKYVEKNTPQGLFDAALTLKEYDGGSFASQILESESEDDYFRDDGSSIVSHGVCYFCSDSEYTMSGGHMVQKNPGLMRVSDNSEMPYRGLVHILSSVNFNGKEYPVVNINEDAFHNCDKVKTVVIDEGLSEISSKAFSYCTGLSDISLPKSLKVLRSFCFEHCTSLKSIFIPAGVTEIENDCFDGCCNLAEIVVDEANPIYMSVDGVLCNRKTGQRLYVPDANKAIDDLEPTLQGEIIEEKDGAFSVDGIRYDVLQDRDYSKDEVRYEKVLRVLPLKDGSYAGNVVIPAKVKYQKRWRRVVQIKEDAFSHCPDLVELSIPSGVRFLPGVSDSPRLCAIHVDEANEEYASMDGVVYNKDKTRIVCYPEGHGDSFEIPSTVRSIDNEFNYCESLRHIVIPQSVTKIDWGAFKGCSGLQEVFVPGSVKRIPQDCFNDCTGLQSITLGEGVQSIDSAFHNCSSLKKLILPDSLETVSISAFGKCGTVEEVRFPKGKFPDINAVPKKFYPWGQPPFFIDGVYYEPYFDYKNQTAVVRVANVPKEQLPQTSFPGIETVAIPPIVEQYGYTYIVDRFWSWCQQFPDLHRLELPETVVDFRGEISTLKEYVVDGENPEFAAIDGVLYSKDLHKLISAPRGLSTKFVVREGVEFIEENAFKNCPGLKELVLSDSVREIGSSAFENCTSLRKVHFNDGLEKIGSSAFINTALTSVVLPASLKDVNHLRQHSGRMPFFLCSDLKEFIMREEGGPLTAIDGVLYEKSSSGLKLIYCPPGFTGRLTIPDGVYSFGYNAMCGAEKLESIVMPDSVKRIEGWAIAGCKALKEVVISRELQYVGSCAFCNCPSLQELNFARCKHYFGYDGIDTSAFMNNPQLKLILPVDIENRRQYFEREMNKKTGW